MSQQTVVARPGEAYAYSYSYGAGSAGFAEVAGPHRRELLAHCYRLLGSLDDAQALVRETWLRAWGAYDTFEGLSSVRLWLYRIATGVCLDALRRGPRRRLQPVPDALVLTEDGDPEAVAVPRESLRLELIANLQCLPARQRAVLLLRDVLGFPAAEAAVVLGTSVEAVKSALQRARANLHAAAAGDAWATGPALPDDCVAAFASGDTDALQRMLGPVADTHLALPSPGDWRMLPTAANGRPAAAAYRRAPDGSYQGFGLAVLTATATALTGVTFFADPTLLPAFALPATLP